jgi:hypothetical protein
MLASFCRLNLRQLRRKLRQLRRKNVYNIVLGLKILAAVLICKNDKRKKCSRQHIVSFISIFF